MWRVWGGRGRGRWVGFGDWCGMFKVVGFGTWRGLWRVGVSSSGSWVWEGEVGPCRS